jgi:uracil-DNA glycosylase
MKEVNRDIKCTTPSYDNGDLSIWNKQGVLLLNTILTVRDGEPMSHGKFGWQYLTNKIIEIVSKNNSKVVFMLWGAEARKLKEKVDRKNGHLILEASHPSPRSVDKGEKTFLNCGHFARCNQFLKLHGRQQIDWKL